MLLLGLVVSAPFGGWKEAVPEHSVATVKPGDTLDTGPLVLTVKDAYWTTRPAETFPAFKGGVYLLVNGTARTNDRQTLGFDAIRSSLRITGLDGLTRDMFSTSPVSAEKGQPTLYHRDDAELLGTLGPGMTYDVAWVFGYVGPTGQLPKDLTVTVYRHTWRKSSITRVEEWLDATPAFEVSLPLTSRPAWTKPAAAS